MNKKSTIKKNIKHEFNNLIYITTKIFQQRSHRIQKFKIKVLPNLI